MTEESLFKGMNKQLSGTEWGTFSPPVQTYCEKFGFGVVRDFVGHGLGREMHEDPRFQITVRLGMAPY